MSYITEKLTSPNNHLAFFNLGKLVVGFIIAFSLTNIFASAPQEAKIIENYEIAMINVEYIEKQVPVDPYKLSIAKAKLKSATLAKKSNDTMAELIDALVNNIYAFLFFFWGIGLLFWWYHVPNKHLKSDT